MTELNQRANRKVRVEVSSPSSIDSRDDGYVLLNVEDDASGEVLVRVEIPAGRWWRLNQGSSQTWPAYVSPHLERVGLTLLTTQVKLPADIDPEDPGREVYRAVVEQLPEEWHAYESSSTRKTNSGWVAIIRRWVPAATEEQTA